MKPTIYLILHDLRSTHNVGAILRSADSFQVARVYCTGHTPYPIVEHDTRLPHLQRKQQAAIHKTALGAEETVPVFHNEDVLSVMRELGESGFQLVALEQAVDSINLDTYRPPPKLALIVGNEPSGIDSAVLSVCNSVVEIPQFGAKESLNVAVAAGIALYHLRCYPQL